MTDSAKSILKEVIVFKELRQEEILEIEEVSTVESYQPNEVIFREGDEGDSLYVVSSGEVRIIRVTDTGIEKVFARLGPRSFFGEMALLDGKPRSAGAVADTPAELIKISKAELDHLIENDSIAAYKVIHAFARTLCYRLRKMNDELLELFKYPEKTVNEILNEKSDEFYIFIGGWAPDD